MDKGEGNVAIQNNRIIYDTSNGKLIYQTGEASGDVPEHGEWGQLAFIEIPYGSIDYNKYFIKGINHETLEPILEAYPKSEPTEDQLRVKQLEEDILLLKTDSDTGGLL